MDMQLGVVKAIKSIKVAEISLNIYSEGKCAKLAE